jgi:hypothetical protein
VPTGKNGYDTDIISKSIAQAAAVSSRRAPDPNFQRG